MRFAAAILVLLGVATGCQSSKPSPGKANARITVVAIPKTGASQPWVRVPVYDAAPPHEEPTGDYERLDYNNLDDIIVWLEPGSASTNSSSPGTQVIGLNPKAPSQSVRPASVGQTITLRNDSSQPLSAYSVSDGNEFETHDVAAGSSATFTVRSEGLIEILADPSQPPIALIYAAPSGSVARARSGKAVTFRDLAPGEYRATAWHPRLPGTTETLSLASDHTSNCTLRIGVNAISNSP